MISGLKIQKMVYERELAIMKKQLQSDIDKKYKRSVLAVAKSFKTAFDNVCRDILESKGVDCGGL